MPVGAAFDGRMAYVCGKFEPKAGTPVGGSVGFAWARIKFSALWVPGGRQLMEDVNSPHRPLRPVDPV